jgi:hypothetical protein
MLVVPVALERVILPVALDQVVVIQVFIEVLQL